jgi:hypothetical protein
VLNVINLRLSSPLSGSVLLVSANKGCLFAGRYQLQTTKSPELIFSALLGDDGARDVRFERALRT